MNALVVTLRALKSSFNCHTDKASSGIDDISLRGIILHPWEVGVAEYAGYVTEDDEAYRFLTA